MRIYSIVSTTISGVLMSGISTVAFAGACAGGANCNSGFNQALAPYEGVPSAICRTRLAANISQASACSIRSVNHPAAADPFAPINYYNSTPYGYLKTFAYKNTPDVNIMRVFARPPMAALNNVPSNFSGGCNPAATGYCGTKAVIAAPAPAPIVAYNPVVRTAPILPIPMPLVSMPIVQPAPLIPMQFRNNSSVQTGNVIGQVSGGTYTYMQQGTPDYWEKTSGATTVSGLPATQIVCRRAGTTAISRTVNVVRPVIGIPQPVPTAVPYCLPSPRPVAPLAMPMAGSRWTH